MVTKFLGIDRHMERLKQEEKNKQPLNDNE